MAVKTISAIARAIPLLIFMNYLGLSGSWEPGQLNA